MAPVTGKFLADFSSFYTAVQQADIALKGMETNAHAVEKRMNAMADSFSGRKLIQDATMAVEAVNSIGGATKLTANEAARLNAQVTEAIAKYTALGKVAPKELRDMAEATDKVVKETGKVPSAFGNITSSLVSMASAVGIAFSAQAIISFVGNVVDTAGKVADLSAKLGIGTEAVQQFTHAAELSGGTIDDVGNAIFKMNDKLSSGEKGTIHALTDLGLKLDNVRKMKPEDAFLAITDALEKIEDPMTRSRLEMELFGKTGGALGAAIDAGFRKTAESANKMSDETIQALDKAGDAWTKLKNGIVIATGTAIGATLNFFEKVENRFDEIVAKTRGRLGLQQVMPGFDAAGNRIPEPEAPKPKPPGATGQPGAAELERLEKEREAAQRKREAAARRAETEARQERARDEKIFEGMRKRTEMFEKQDATLWTSTQALQAYIKEHRTAAEVISATIPASATEAFTGYGKAIEHVSGVLKTNTADMTRWEKQVSANAREAHIFFQQLPTASEEFYNLGQSISQVAGILGSSLLGSLGNVISKMANVKGAISDLRGGFDKITSGGGLTSILGGFTSIVSGIGGIVSAAQAAIAIGKTLFGLFDRNKGRDLVVDFAESMGGFDALHEKLLTLGEAGEALWIKLTQGVGRNNPEQASKVIGEVEDALAKQEDAASDAADATEAEARATIETATEAAKALDDLAPKIEENRKRWEEWSVSVTGYIDNIANALKALQLPTLNADAAAKATANGGGTAVVNLDGRTIAEAVVPAIPGVVKRYGLA